MILKFKKVILFFLPAALTLGSCTDFTNDFDANKHQYAQNFTKEFGEIDPNQDWSMATQVNANVNIPELKGKGNMNIMTGDPRNASTRLLAQAMLEDGKSQLKFDAIKGMNNVFVSVEMDGKYKVFGEYAIEDGLLNIGKIAPVVRATRGGETCPVTLDGELKETSVSFQPSRSGDPATGTAVISHNPYNAGTTTKSFDEWKADVIAAGAGYASNNMQYPFDPSSIIVWSDPTQQYLGFTLDWSHWTLRTDCSYMQPTATYSIPGWTETGKVNFQYMNGVVKEPTEPITRATLISLMGKEGFFREYIPYWGNSTFDKTSLYGIDADEKLETMKKIEKGFAVKTATTGPVSVPFLFGATGNQNQFGYILYKDGEDPLTKPHYILMDDARPDKNVFEASYGGTTYTGTGWYDQFLGDFYDLVDAYKDVDEDHMQTYIDGLKTKVYGTNYKLVYFPEEGDPTYDIPAETNIVFFLARKASGVHDNTIGSDVGSLSYSLPELNERIGSLYETFCTDETLTKAAGSSPIGAVRACTWQIGSNIYLGFEDGTDVDVNDIVFLVDGDFEHDDDRIVLHDIIWYLNDDPANPEGTVFHKNSNKVGIAYQQPSSNPVNNGKTFLGWAESPDGVPISGSETAGTITGFTPEGGKKYYAIWEGVTPDPTPDPEWVSWIFACEDLGGTYDYDFNDVVWEVRKDGISGKVQARLLAAGGTLPFTLMYESTKICSKADVYGVGNVSKVYINQGSDWFNVLTDTEWTISSNSGKFKVAVEGSGTAEIITAPTTGAPNNKEGSKVPEVILVPGNWEWPTEGTCIKDAYKDFIDWTFSAGMTGWADSKQADKTVSR